MRHRAYALAPGFDGESPDVANALFALFLVQALSETVLEGNAGGLTFWFDFFGSSLLFSTASQRSRVLAGGSRDR